MDDIFLAIVKENYPKLYSLDDVYTFVAAGYITDIQADEIIRGSV